MYSEESENMSRKTPTFPDVAPPVGKREHINVDVSKEYAPHVAKSLHRVSQSSTLPLGTAVLPVAVVDGTVREYTVEDPVMNLVALFIFIPLCLVPVAMNVVQTPAEVLFHTSQLGVSLHISSHCSAVWGGVDVVLIAVVVSA
jgi:hypothetical protein